MATFAFDASTVTPQASYTPIPAGVYLACVTDSDVVPLKSGAGQGMKLTFEILEGQFVKRKIFEHLNIQHSNPDTERIAQSQLSALCHAVGVVRLTDTAMLHDKPVKIRVKIRPAAGDFEARNQVSGYESAAGAAPAAFGGAAPAANAPAAAAPAAPWVKRTA